MITISGLISFSLFIVFLMSDLPRLSAGSNPTDPSSDGFEKKVLKAIKRACQLGTAALLIVSGIRGRLELTTRDLHKTIDTQRASSAYNSCINEMDRQCGKALSEYDLCERSTAYDDINEEEIVCMHETLGCYSLGEIEERKKMALEQCAATLKIRDECLDTIRNSEPCFYRAAFQECEALANYCYATERQKISGPIFFTEIVSYFSPPHNLKLTTCLQEAIECYGGI